MTDVVNQEVLFIGPGHNLFNFSSLWIIRFRGHREIIGKNGNEVQLDTALLSECLTLATKGSNRYLEMILLEFQHLPLS